MDTQTLTRYKQAGYTHLLTFKKVHKSFGTVPGMFPTTADALKVHASRLDADKNISELQILDLNALVLGS